MYNCCLNLKSASSSVAAGPLSVHSVTFSAVNLCTSLFCFSYKQNIKIQFFQKQEHNHFLVLSLKCCATVLVFFYITIIMGL